MTKKQAIVELKQALSKVGQELALFEAAEDQQAQYAAWAELVYETGVQQTAWEKLRDEYEPRRKKLVGPYPSADKVEQEVSEYEDQGWKLDGEIDEFEFRNLEGKEGLCYVACVTQPLTGRKQDERSD